MTGVRLATTDDVDAIGAVMGRAFQADPLFEHTTPDAEQRRRAGTPHMTAYVRVLVAEGEVWVTDDLTAAAGWLRPGERDVPPEKYAAAGFDAVRGIVGEEGWARMGAVFTHIDARLVALGVPEHWYLTLIGVEPDRQSQGLGAAVLAPVLARADETGVACYLETYAARGVPFYERHGFEVVEAAAAPGSGLPYWLMLRPPVAP